jgi:dihydroflavonol-4-reductase
VTVLVTGATGFVGSAVVRRLVASSVAVRALVRPGSNQRNLEGLPVTVVTGDLTDPASLQRALAGCKGLFHVAADYRLWVRDPAAMYHTNVEGTRALLQAAARAGLERIVYTSSVATLGLRADGQPSDEDTESSLADMIGHYKRSKYLAEEVVRELAPTPTGRMIVDALAGRMPAYVDTGLNMVHVDDVAAGHLLAYERGTVGRRYVLGAEDMTLQEILGELARISGRRPPRFRIPHTAVLPVAHLAEGWARISGREPGITVDGVRLAKKRMFFSSARAQRELGYRPGEARAALRDAAVWFRANGYVS